MGNVNITPTLNKGIGKWALDITTQLPNNSMGPTLHFDQDNSAAATLDLPSGLNMIGLDGNGPQPIPGTPPGTRTLSVAVSGDITVNKTHDFAPGPFIGDLLSLQVL